MRCTDAQRRDHGRARRRLTLRILATAGALLTAGAVAAGGSTLAGIRAGRNTVHSDPFAGGTVVLTRIGSGAFLSFRDLSIGATRTGRLTIANEGSVAGELVLSASVRPNPLADRLRLEVRSGGRAIYRGSLGGFHSARAGRLQPGGRRTFVFRLRLPSTGSAARDDELQGEAVDASFRWSAVAA